MLHQPCVYILSSEKHGTLYIGVTSDINQRVWQHKQKYNSGFTQKYHITNLVYVECHQTMYEAITREKQMKKWKRAWKVNLIEENNPDWNDLWPLV